MRRNFKHSNKNFYNNKPVINAPDLPRMEATSSSFPSEIDYIEGGNAKTAFQRLRDYDIKVDKVELNIAGAAEIYGKRNNREAFVWQNDSVGIYTGNLNDKYVNDDFRLLSTISRNITLKYWGIDFNNPATSADKLMQDRAVATWIKNCSTLLQHIEASRTFDLSISNLSYQPPSGSTARTISKWATVFKPLEYLLIAYQTELMGYIYLVQSFMTLTSMLPKLQEIYYAKSDFFTEIQNQLKRSRFTSIIRSLLTWLKKRFVDTSFYKQVFAPLTVVSKKTDGLNSPIIYLKPTLNIAVEPLACQLGTHSANQYIPGDFHFIQRFMAGTTVRDNDGYVTGMGTQGNSMLERTFNAFSVDTILDMILQSNRPDLIKSAINTWTQTAESLLTQASHAALNFSNDEVIIALESMLAKLSTAPGTSSVNWQQNLEVNNLPPIIKFTDWEAVNELVLFAATTPKDTSNGYEMKVPMFANTGIQKQLQLEYFQAFYLPSNKDYISYVELDKVVTFRTRKNEVINAVMKAEEDKVVYQIKQFNDTTKEWEYYAIDPSLASLIFQDRFTAIRFQPQLVSDSYTTEHLSSDEIEQLQMVAESGELLATTQSVVEWTNPNLMNYVTIAYTNRGAEFEVWNTQNFIIPLG